MKRKLTYSILSLIIILSCPIVGCSSSTKETEPANTWAIDLLDKVPNGSSVCRITNLSAIRTDPDLSADYESITNFGFWDMNGLETDNQSLDYAIETDSLTIFIGELDIEAVTANLNVNGSNYRKVNDTEIWDWEYEWREPGDIFGALFNGVVAIKDELLIYGHSEDDIKTWLNFTANASPSINSNPDFNDLFSRLPNGFWITYSTTPPDDLETQGLESAAGVMSKKDHEFLSLTGIYKYQDEGTSKEAYPDIKTQIENDNEAQNVQVTRDGKYIMIKADYPISSSTDN